MQLSDDNLHALIRCIYYSYIYISFLNINSVRFECFTLYICIWIKDTDADTDTDVDTNTHADALRHGENVTKTVAQLNE